MQSNDSHKQILKSTTIIGGSQFFAIIIGIVRTKIIAVLLGSVGVGLIGLYQSAVDLISSATGFGLHFSGVRDIAEANADNDKQRLAKSAVTLQRWRNFTGLLGALSMIVLCVPLSRYSFGNNLHAAGIAVLSIAVLATALLQGQIALLQGMRRIADRAKITIWASVLGLIVSVPLYFFFGTDGIVPSIIILAVANLLVSWYYARKIKIERTQITYRQSFWSGLGMIKLGFFTVVTGFASTAVMYVLRSFVSEKMGYAGVGFFQVASSISTIYIGMVLSAMSADYFPRLSAVNTKNTEANKLVNEQTEVALMLGAPMIVALLLFTPLAIKILYSSEFLAATSITQWQIVGTMLRLLTWPIGFLLLAKKKGLMFVASELLHGAVYLSVSILLYPALQLDALGVAYIAAYIVYGIFIFACAKKISSFAWTKRNLTSTIIFATIIILSLCNVKYMNGYVMYVFGIVLCLFAFAYAYSELKHIVSLREIFGKIKSIFKKK